jgi:RNA polymerase sigma-70 factor (ECF subfamily)
VKQPVPTIALVRAPAPQPQDTAVDSRSDDELMLLARGGSHAAFDRLVQRHQGRVLCVAARHLGRSDLAPDVAQNTFVQIYRALPRYQPRGKFVAYLYCVLLSQCRIAHRSARVERQALGEAARLPSRAAEGADEQILARERQREVESAVQKLSEKLRAVVLLRYSAGLEYQMIAEALGVPVGTVKRRLFDAVEKLRRKMEDK